jgi:tetratricopeptide (TPR) repeat protein
LLEQERSDDAFVLFDALYLSGRMLDQARYYLGRIEQYRKNYSQAIEWYSAIEEGDLLIEGEIRSAGLLILNGEYQEGGRRFAQLRNEVPEIAVKAYLTESDFLYHAKQYSQGYALLTQALLEIPDEPSLLYSRGMLAERMDRIELLEQDMRAILQLDPDHAHALNALGYTFVDRNIRLDEAQALIRRALALLPDSPAVIDSMAWFYYRKGEYQKAEALLRRALELEDSPDILAHLIELLWQKGQKEEAIDELERGLERFTDHETLNEQKMRYQP